jgi:hypothetical protein
VVSFVAAPVAVALAAGVVAGGGAAAGRRGCRAGEVGFVAQTQPYSSTTIGFSVIARTMMRGLACTVVGYPSLRFPSGDHGSLRVVMRPHLVGARGPGHVVTLSSARAKTGGFYILNTHGCGGREEVEARVRFGLPDGERASGSVGMMFCRHAEALIEVGPFNQ